MKKPIQVAASAIAFSTALLMPITVNANGFGDLLILVADGGGHGGGGGGHGGGGGGHGGGHSSGGHESDSHSSGGHGGSSHSSGSQRGSGKGAGGQKGSGGGASKRPNWAGKELTDIGRMNVIKAPPSVLYRVLDPVNLEDYDASLYSGNLANFLANFDSLDQIIDSPVANMGILTDLWVDADGDGKFVLSDVTVTNRDDLAAITIGVGANKDLSQINGGTGITTEMVDALATIVFGEVPSSLDTTQIAIDANKVLDAVVTVHNS